MKKKIAFMIAATLLLPLFIIKIPWYLLVLIYWLDEKIGEIYQEMEDEVFKK